MKLQLDYNFSSRFQEVNDIMIGWEFNKEEQYYEIKGLIIVKKKFFIWRHTINMKLDELLRISIDNVVIAERVDGKLICQAGEGNVLYKSSTIKSE